MSVHLAEPHKVSDRVQIASKWQDPGDDLFEQFKFQPDMGRAAAAGIVFLQADDAGVGCGAGLDA